jgi:CH-like domain in sperm protein
VAELLSKFYPKEFNMRTYENGLSAHFRNDNWTQIQGACQRHGFQLPSEIVSAVMLEKHGAAVELLELLYEQLSGKKILRKEDVRFCCQLYCLVYFSANELSETGNLQVKLEGDAADKGDGGNDKEIDPMLVNFSGSTIQPVGLAPEKPIFGDVVTKDIQDGADIRKKFARG